MTIDEAKRIISDRYGENLRLMLDRNIEMYDGGVRLSNFIDSSMSWSSTPQQHPFWSNLQHQVQIDTMDVIRTVEPTINFGSVHAIFDEACDE